MTARILIVDDVPANVRLLEARLLAEYFEVVTATNGYEALDVARRGNCDVILLDVMMPGMDGFETCRRLKEDPQTAFIPVVMVTALDQPSDRVRGLEAGADDFLSKPVSEIALLTRVKSLARLKTLTDELRMRANTGHSLGTPMDFSLSDLNSNLSGRILLVDDKRNSQDRISKILSRHHQLDVEANVNNAVIQATEGNYDLVIISLDLDNFDGLRICSQLKSMERMRHLPVLIITEPHEDARLIRGLEMGVNDYVVRPIDKNEMLARVQTQIRRKRFADHLRATVQKTMEAALTDVLTGLNNRRYMEQHMETLVAQAHTSSKPLSVMLFDIDFFKAVNDTYGHEAGDDVLREFAKRLRKAVRGIDLVCRNGGEEFVVVMPETHIGVALKVAERIRRNVAEEAFSTLGGRQVIDVTVSIGVSTIERMDDTPMELLRKADKALYAAKRDGRNRVVSEAA